MPSGPDIVTPYLDAYLFGRVRFADALALQRRLVYEIGGQRERAALMFCEHSPTVTIGRQGSEDHIEYTEKELDQRGWPIYRVNRGDGCLLHVPGQLNVYPVIAIDAFGLSLTEYLDRLSNLVVDFFRGYGLMAEVERESGNILIGDRAIGQIGLAVRDWVAYYGLALNINPDLSLFRAVRCGGRAEPMTSLQRELRGPVRTAEIRQRILTSFRDALGLDRWSVLHQHPTLPQKRITNAVPTHYREAL